MNSEPVTLFM